MSSWRFLLVEPDGTQIGELTAATSKQVTWLLDGASFASFNIDGYHPQAALISELETDLIVYDSEGIARFRGRLGSSTDDLSPSGFTSTFSAVDYRGMLGRRIIWNGSTTTFSAREQADIAWTLIDDSQALGDWGITQGSGRITGVARDRTYQEGQVIGDLIAQLGEVDNGFDWEIDATLAFNVFYPQRGRDADVALDYGGRVARVQRNLDTSTFANAVRESGSDFEADGTTPLAAATAVAASFGTPGRFETQVGDPTVVESATLTAKATAELAKDEDVQPSYSLVLRPGWWTPQAFWLGDTGHLSVKAGRLAVDTTQRCSRIELAVGDDGGETVTLTTGPVPSTIITDSLSALQRLSALERR